MPLTDYTAPLHGFASAEDYWTRCSSRPWLGAIKVPTLIVNAGDDPFFAGGCYPAAECADNDKLTLKITRHGGHVGFVRSGKGGRYWFEERAVRFMREVEGARAWEQQKGGRLAAFLLRGAVHGIRLLFDA